jgi:hypothetical protein
LLNQDQARRSPLGQARPIKDGTQFTWNQPFAGGFVEPTASVIRPVGQL